ncbi:hypothetical protein QYS48_33815 [Marivirga arenosa]|uniref:Uncharacterized protein n=1 Tax=Marivirga arenosa TaxID=3059076 RepID=A0AA51N967_9BACT|nr:hypothetical protein [Marivirga sp. ABR2-2]WMN06811.1 hypothetical protein QYS48_33815 [Marivirga sp. ABR2-2]
MKVIFVELRMIRSNLYRNYDIAEIKQNGNEVEIWHVGKIVNAVEGFKLEIPNSLKGLIKIFYKREELDLSISELTGRVVFISQLGLQRKYPSFIEQIRKYDNFAWIGRITKQAPTSGWLNNSNIFQYLKRFVPIRYEYEPDVLLLATSKDVLRLKFPNDPKKIVIQHSEDYNEYIRLIETERPIDFPKNYVVFLDQMICHQPAVLASLGENFIDKEKYKRKLIGTLSEIQEILQLPILIAAHPESEKYPEYLASFPFKVIKSRSAELVKFSKLVVTHYSTAINFAVIYKKPILLLDFHEFNNHKLVKKAINNFQYTLDITKVFIDEKINKNDIKLSVNEDCYKHYFKKNIKEEDTIEELTYPYLLKLLE